MRGETIAALRTATDGLSDLDGLPAILAAHGAGRRSGAADRLEEFGDFVAKIDRDLTAVEAIDLPALLAAMRDEFEGRDEDYYRLRRAQQAVNESLKREDAIKQQIVQIEKLERELERLMSEEQELVRKRKATCETVRRLSDQITAV